MSSYDKILRVQDELGVWGEAWDEFVSDLGNGIVFAMATAMALLAILRRAAAARTSAAAAAVLNEFEAALTAVGLPVWWEERFYTALAPWDGWETTWPDGGRTRFDVPTYRWVAEHPSFEGPPIDVTPAPTGEPPLVPHTEDEELDFVRARAKWWAESLLPIQEEDTLRNILGMRLVSGVWLYMNLPEERVMSQWGYNVFRDELGRMIDRELCRRNDKE